MTADKEQVSAAAAALKAAGSEAAATYSSPSEIGAPVRLPYASGPGGKPQGLNFDGPDRAPVQSTQDTR